jgi:hypothetical protein
MKKKSQSEKGDTFGSIATKYFLPQKSCPLFLSREKRRELPFLKEVIRWYQRSIGGISVTVRLSSSQREGKRVGC